MINMGELVGLNGGRGGGLEFCQGIIGKTKKCEMRVQIELSNGSLRIGNDKAGVGARMGSFKVNLIT